jgi:hypothetical protein
LFAFFFETDCESTELTAAFQKPLRKSSYHKIIYKAFTIYCIEDLFVVKQMRKEILAISTITLILLATFASIPINSSEADASSAVLTGNIHDHGEDTDEDGLFNFLVVEVEVNVSLAGTYTVQVFALRDIYSYQLSVYLSNTTYLDTGVWNVSLPCNGIRIHAYRFNPKEIYEVHLYDAYYQWLDYRSIIALSKTYSCTLFDIGAALTGNLYDGGVDTDSDGLYNYLGVGAEVNVSDAGLYQIYVSQLMNTTYSYIYSVSNETEEYLSPGIHVLTVLLNGASIYASHMNNISVVYYLSLFGSDAYGYFMFESMYHLNLNNLYNYDQFESPAYFTGRVYDQGVDTDMNLKYDCLKISVEVNFTKAGDYYIEIQSLVDDASHYLYIYQSVTDHFEAGVQLVNLTVYGTYIYAQHFNPRYIGEMRVLSLSPWLALDVLSNIPLPTLYSYADFESHALLTGKISDRGVDTDGDGLFDYLEIGIEVNVTEAARYRVCFSQLVEKLDGYYSYLYMYQSVEADFTVGLHTVYFKCSGPELAYQHFSPTNISYIYLYEGAYPYIQLGYVPTASLSKKYQYTLFNHPLDDMQVNFVVYPNGTTGVSGVFNYTHMYPQNVGLQMNSTLNISTTDGTTTGSASGTFLYPKDSMYSWPLDYTTADFASKYDNGLLNTTLDASLFVPPEYQMKYPVNASDFSFTSAYSNGLFTAELWGETQIPSDVSMLLYNITDFADFVILADYAGNEVDGNITFHALPGFTLGDIVVNFDGNKTDLYLTGHVNVTYGDFFDMEVNSTIVDEMLTELNDTILGPTGMVHQATFGLLDCTQFDYVKTPWYNETAEAGADVQYTVAIHGNFTGFFARILAQMMNPYNPDEAVPVVFAALDSALSTTNASLVLSYYHISKIATLDLHLVSDVKALWTRALELIPPSLPPAMPLDYRTEVEAMIKIANATAYAIKNFSLDASYSSAEQRLDLNAWLLVNETQLENDITPIIPDTVPPPLREIVRSYVNTTYCKLTSSNLRLNYVNGTGDFNAEWVFQGDYEAQLNQAKHFYVDYLYAFSPWMVSWQLRVLNETEVNINNLEAEVNIGKDWMYATFDGVTIQPPKSILDSVRFKLYKLFNMTYGPYEPPGEFEKLKITVTGGSNGTLTVLLHAPPGVLNPDHLSLDYKAMTWDNTKMSNLRDLVFQIAYQQIIPYLGKDYYAFIFTNSTMSNFQFTPSMKSISFNVTGTSGTGFCNITIPRALLYASLGNWTVNFDGRPLPPENFTVTQNAEYVFIYLNYSHSDHTIEIIGRQLVTEFQPDVLAPALIILSIIAAVIAVKKRKRLSILRTKYQSSIRNFARTLRQSKT